MPFTFADDKSFCSMEGIFLLITNDELDVNLRLAKHGQPVIGLVFSYKNNEFFGQVDGDEEILFHAPSLFLPDLWLFFHAIEHDVAQDVVPLRLRCRMENARGSADLKGEFHDFDPSQIGETVRSDANKAKGVPSANYRSKNRSCQLLSIPPH
jgi:hypothetical protein